MLIKTAFVGLLCVVGVGLMEGLCSVASFWQYGTVNVARLNELDIGNEVVASAPAGYAASLQPHPYLGSVYNQKGGANNVGTRGHEFPIEHDPSKFTLLLTGGSVAGLLAESGELERALNDQLELGQPVVVLNGGGGGWHQPQQTIMLALYGDVCDAVITLDGFNERYTFEGSGSIRLEAQSTQFASLNPLLNGGYERLAGSWECNRLRQFSQRHNSRTLFYITKAMRRQIEASSQGSSENGLRTWMLPEEWPSEKRHAFNLAQYRKYLRLMDAMSAELRLKTAHFVQPCPAIDKILTTEERAVVQDLGYAERYQWLANQLPAISLLDCFQSTEETVYIDKVHCNRAGHAIMAERIAEELSRLWNIPKRAER